MSRGTCDIDMSTPATFTDLSNVSQFLELHRSLPISRDQLEESYGAAKYYLGGYMQRPQHLSTWTPKACVGSEKYIMIPLPLHFCDDMSFPHPS